MYKYSPLLVTEQTPPRRNSERIPSQTIDIEIIKYRARNRLMLIGDPGSGKSTTLQIIGNTLIDEYRDRVEDRDTTSYLPFYINLGDHNNPVDPHELIERWWKASGITANLDTWLKFGSLFLLLDGLNEMPDGIGSKSIKNRYLELRNFLTQEYAGPAIVTCRVANYQDNLDLGLEAIRIRRLRGPQIYAFAVKQLNEQADDFLEALIAHPESLALATNVLSLSLLIQLFQKNYDNLPDNGRALYDQYIQMRHQLASRQGSGDKVRSRLPFLYKSLGRLAFRIMMEGVGNNLDLPTAYRLARVGLKPFSGRQAIKDGLRLGILEMDRATDRDNRLIQKVRFYHPTFYEHFAVPYVSLARGDVKRRKALIQTLEHIGRIALPALPTLADYYFNGEEIYIRTSCRSAIMSIALDTQTESGVYIALSLMLETAIRLYLSFEDIKTQHTMRMDLVANLRSDFQLAFAKALREIVIATRIRFIEGNGDQRGADLWLAERLTDMVSRLNKLLDYNPQINPIEAGYLSVERRENFQVIVDSYESDFRAAQEIAERMTEPYEYTQRNAEQLVITLAEARIVMERKEPGDSGPILLNYALTHHRQIIRDVIAKAHELTQSVMGTVE